MKHNLIGDKNFYKQLLRLALPIMIQNGITNFVNMLDNIMVGRVGTAPMTGVAVSNQLIFVFNLCIFGAVSGAGIFGAQFYGKDDHEGVRNTFRFKVEFCTVLCVIGILVLVFFGTPLVNLYLNGEGKPEDSVASLGFAKDYIAIMIIGLLPYTIVQCYSSTLRETGQTMLPMFAGIVSVLINLSLNYILIFGNLGAPELGVTGAAIATAVSRFAELAIVVVWTHKNSDTNRFIIGAFKSLHIPLSLVKQIAVKGLPLMGNEAMWSLGFAVVNQCYSQRGLNVVAANNISQTFFNVFSVAFMAVGSAIGIMLGQMLGSNHCKEAEIASKKLIAFSVFVSVIVGILYAVCAQFIPMFYNTNDQVRYLAKRLMQISAVMMPLDAFSHAAYFTLRSGGKTFVTILFDSCFVWFANIPLVFVLTRFTSVPILYLYAACQSLNLIKCVIGYILVKKGTWIRNIVK